MATISDVARVADVSVSTVSYAISGIRPISAETRRRVFAAMDELGYQPHAMARGLASKRSRILALLYPTQYRSLGLTEIEFVVAAADSAEARGYYLILSPSAANQAAEVRRLAQLGLVDGVILMEVHEDDARIAELSALDFPFSLIGRCADNSGLDSADTDFESTMDAAVRYLVERGHRSIGFITQSQASIEAGYGPTVRACKSFTDALAWYEAHGSIQFSAASAAAGAAALHALCKAQPDVTAVLVMNDPALGGIMQTLVELGLRMPEDVSLVTLVSSPRVGEMFHPALTTFVAASEETARLGVELLIDRLENPAHVCRQVLVACKLIERGSVATPRQAPVGVLAA